ncbi:MAG: efflux RND transporter periplasmic adaptor subunit [Bacteroidia bacterium]
MKKKHWIIGGVIMALIVTIWWYNSATTSEDIQVTTTVKKGEFVSEVVTAGELEAKNSVRIYGPREMRQYRLSDVKIQDLVAEGTRVKKGDYIGSLDPTPLDNARRDVLSEFEKTESQYQQVRLDTAIELRAKRDELKNLKFALEEREIELKYSEFEPPAIQRQAQIALEKSQRAYKNAIESYELKRRQSVAKVREVGASLNIQKTKIDKLNELMKAFKIYAPEDGMFLYAKDGWSGTKRKAGSTIRPWDPFMGELPDMSIMVSKTFINEVDISKISKGMKVVVGIDAFPEKTFDGEITYVANVGEDKAGINGKAFEVMVQLNETDTIIRPGMTTSNRIQIFTEESALYIPLEAISSQDSIYYAAVKDGLGFEKREVKLGKSNENEVIVLAGLNEDEEVFLVLPQDIDETPITLLPNSDKE